MSLPEWPNEDELRSLVRRSLSTLLAAPHPVDFPSASDGVREYLAGYAQWHKEMVLPLRDVLHEMVEALDSASPELAN